MKNEELIERLSKKYIETFHRKKMQYQDEYEDQEDVENALMNDDELNELEKNITNVVRDSLIL